jgi:hypothetical protein
LRLESEGKCPVESEKLTQLENDASPNSIVTRKCSVESKNVCPNSIFISVIDLVGSVSVPSSVTEYPVENKLLAQRENDVSTNSVVNKSAAGHVDSSAVTVQEMPVVKPMDAKEKQIFAR